MDHGEKVTDPIFMETLLQGVQNSNKPFNITIARKPGNYQSTLLDFDFAAQILIFDRLNPDDGHLLLLKSRIISAETCYNGVSIRLQCHLKKPVKTAQSIHYYMHMPTHLWYCQQRKNFRVQLGSDFHFSLRINSATYGWLNAEVIDISPDGCGLKFNEQIAFKKGDIIRDSEIILPNKQKLSCKLMVKYISNDDQLEYSQLGVKIIDLSDDDKKIYLQALKNAQRELVHRQANLVKAS